MFVLLKKVTLSLLCLCFSFASAFAIEDDGFTEVTVTGQAQAQPIAIPIFEGDDPVVAKEITDIIMNDLTRYGLFHLVDPASYIDNHSINERPHFQSWRAIEAPFLLKGHVYSDGWNINVQFRLWDTVLEEEKIGFQHSGSYDVIRRIAHTISDTVYEQITGEEGYFNSRVVYISESGPSNDLQRRLAIMDQDGANQAYLSDGTGLVLTPRYSPSKTRHEITYISYELGLPKVYLLDINTGRREVLGEFEGMTFAPRFSPDGNQVVLSQTIDAETNIFIYDLNTGNKKQLTTGSAIDTAPCYSPDGKYIVFESDREGSQQLYIMDVNGENLRRISHGQGRYAAPVWSPRGNLIAYTRMFGGKFYIGVIEPSGENDRLLTKDYLVEGPTWSPNGQVIIFTRQKSSASPRQLFGIDVTGFYETLIETPSSASDPAWSPNLY